MVFHSETWTFWSGVAQACLNLSMKRAVQRAGQNLYTKLSKTAHRGHWIRRLEFLMGRILFVDVNRKRSKWRLYDHELAYNGRRLVPSHLPAWITRKKDLYSQNQSKTFFLNLYNGQFIDKKVVVIGQDNLQGGSVPFFKRRPDPPDCEHFRFYFFLLWRL